MLRYLTIKDKNQELLLFHHRIIAVSILIGILLVVLVARLYFLQVKEHERFIVLSNENQLTLIPIDPPRGLIFDRNGVLLADNKPVYSLDLIPDRLKNIRNTIEELNKLIPISATNIKDFYRVKNQSRRYQPVPLKMNLTDEEVAKFAVNQWRFPGVAANARLLRYYPQGASNAHPLGYVGRINEQEQDSLDTQNYSASNYIGKSGVEKYYEKILHGTVGSQQVETDAAGRIVRVLKRTPPVAGADLHLSIDSSLELVAEKALGENSGAVVAIDPNTGQVLALVSHPSFDPNLFVQGINPATYKELQLDKQRPLYNRALRGVYPPGSTIKPFYALGGLIYKTISPSFTISDPGYFSFGNHTYRDWKKGGHGRVNLRKAVVISCDTYFYTLATKQGIDNMGELLTNFGFGKLTGIDMTDELPALVPTQKWKRQRFNDKWYMGDTISMGIGQGYLNVTPLQLAVAVSTIANSGKHLKPRLLEKIVYADGRVEKPKPGTLTPVKTSSFNWDFIHDAMHGVITEGTGRHRFGENVGYEVAGKTGTAQVFSLRGQNYNAHGLPLELRDNSLFIAWAPVEHPVIAIAVVAEHTLEAGHIARAMLDYYILKKPYDGKKIEPTPTVVPADR